MKLLNMEFYSANKQSTHRLQVKAVNNELDADSIRKAMDQIAGLGIFADKTGDLVYAKPVSASYIDTNEKVVFDEKIK